MGLDGNSGNTEHRTALDQQVDKLIEMAMEHGLYIAAGYLTEHMRIRKEEQKYHREMSNGR